MDTNLISLSTQAAGSAVIGIITLLLARALHRPYVWYWTLGWLSQALGLGLLLAALRVPAHFLLLAPLSLFAQYVFGFLRVAGCANYATGARPAPRHRWWLLAGGVAAVVMGVAARRSLHVLLLVHAPVLAGVFAAAWRALRPARDAHRDRLGLHVASIALVLLAILFLHYGPVLLWAQWLGHAHVVYLQYRWLYDLILETLPGFGLIMLVMETVRGRVAPREPRAGAGARPARGAGARGPAHRGLQPARLLLAARGAGGRSAARRVRRRGRRRQPEARERLVRPCGRRRTSRVCPFMVRNSPLANITTSGAFASN